MFKLFRIILRRDLMLAFRRKSDLAQVIFFFAVVVTLVPLGVGAETNILRSIAPGVVWVAALLAALLSLPRMFEADHADGTLEQMLVTAEPLPVVVVAKVFAHWLVTGVPMTIFAAVFGILFDLPLDVTLVMVASLFLGTPVLSLVGAVGAALTLGLRGGGVLTSLLVLPLYIPVLIFGAGASQAVAVSMSPAAHFMIVGGLTLLSLALAGSVLAGGCSVGSIARARALATTTAIGRPLGLGCPGLATALTAAATLALALTGASIGFSIATTALGHRRAGQTVGTRQAIAHVDAVFAIELHERQAHLGRLDALEHVARHAVGAAVAALLGGLLFATLRARHIG